MNIVKGKYYKYNHPNGFVLKALDDSTGDNFRAVVVLKGNFNYEVGHEDRLWSVSRFVESDLSEFLEEANKRYPMGSQYKSAFYLDGNDENHYGIIKFFIAGFVTITGIYFYRNYYIDKKIILDKGYEMVNINDGDDSNIDDEINEAAEMHKNVNIKDLKYIPVNTNDE
jgi:hypothetical protein